MGNCDRKSEIIGIQVAKIGYVNAKQAEKFRILIQRLKRRQQTANENFY